MLRQECPTCASFVTSPENGKCPSCGADLRETDAHSFGSTWSLPRRDCLSDARVAAYLQGSLPADEAAEAEAHIGICAICEGRLTEHARHSDEQGNDPAPISGDPIPKRIGPYLVVELIGSGSFGNVYLCQDPMLQRRVAVKVPKREGFGTGIAFESYISEARKAVKLEHPGIVPIYEARMDKSGQFYVVMKYLEGGTLAGCLAANLPTPNEAASKLAVVADTLAHVHRQDIVHRDLKPSNILLDGQGQPFVADFGLALEESLRWERAGEFAGTRQYMSPEQVRGDAHRLDGRTDIWALGVILYQLLTGRLPFRSDSQAQLQDEILHGDPKPPRMINPDVPERLEAICLRCLAKAPADRFSSAADLAKSLRGGSSKALGPNPYRGLAAFQEQDAHVFFGREELVGLALARIRDFVDAEDETRLLAIIGASGSGKSSLAYAGVLAAIRRSAIDESSSWPIVICRPGHNPVEGLAVGLVANAHFKQVTGDIADLIDRLRTDRRRLHLITRLALEGKPAAQRVVVLVDQFEEIFRPGDEELKVALMQNLLSAASAPDGRTIVLLTMRADFYAKASAYPELAAALSNSQVLVGPMTPDQRRGAIEKPAQLAGAKFETGLVDMLLQDMKTEAGALPFLQDALTQLWERQQNGVLLVDDYKAIGRLEGAIEHRANELFESFDEVEQEACRRLFLRLTQPGEGTEDTKRRVPRSELGESRDVEKTLQKLAAARLITTEGDSQADAVMQTAFVEVSHEALIRGWSRLRQWIDDDRDALRIQHQLSADASQWNQSSDEAFLYRGTRLGIVEDWMQSHAAVMTTAETEFIAASQALRDREERERAAAAARLRRWAWAAGIAAVLAGVGAIAASVMAIGFNMARQDQQRQRELADQRAAQARYESRVADAQRLATEAEDLLDENPVASLQRAAHAVNTIYTPGGQRPKQEDSRNPLNVLHSALDALKRHDVTLALGSPPSLIKPVVSPENRYLVMQSYDRRVHLWDLKDAEVEPHELFGPDGSIAEAVFGPNDRWLVVRSEGGRVRTWDLSHLQLGHVDLPTHEDPVLAVEFDKTGRWLMTANHEVIRIWSVNADEMPASPTKVLRTVGGMPDRLPAAFSDDGRWLVLDDEEGLRLWPLDDFSSTSEPVHLSDFRATASELASQYYAYSRFYLELDEYESQRARYTTRLNPFHFASQGRWMLVRRLIDQQAELALLDLHKSPPGVVRLPSGDGGGTNSRPGTTLDAAFSEDASKLAISSTDPRSPYLGIRVWQLPVDDADAADAPQTLTTLPLRVDAIVGDRWLVASTRYGTYGEGSYLWDLSGRPRPFNFGADTYYQRPRFSPDGRWMIASSRSRYADWVPVIHDLGAANPAAAKYELLANTASNRLIFTNDSKWLVIAKDQSIVVWNLKGESPFSQMNVLTMPSVDTSVRDVLATRDGNKVIVAGDWSARLFGVDDQDDWQSQRVLPALRDIHTPISSTDQWLVSPSSEGLMLTKLVGDSATVKAWTIPASNVSHTRILPDDRFVVATRTGRIELWRLPAGQQEMQSIQLASDIGHVTAVAVAPNHRWLAVGSEDGKIHLWEIPSAFNGDSQTVVLDDHDSSIVCLAIDPDSRWLVSNSYDGRTLIRSFSLPSDIRTWIDPDHLARGLIDVPNDDEQLALVSADDWTTSIWNARLRAAMPYVKGTPRRAEHTQTHLFGFAPQMPDGLKSLTPQTPLGQPQLLRHGRTIRSSWSPDNSQVVFSGDRGLGTLDITNGDVRELIPFGKDPVWSPSQDDPWIAFVAGRYEVHEEIWLVRPDGSEALRLAEGGYPTWAENGKKLYFRSRDQVLRYVDLTGPDRIAHDALPIAMTHDYPAVSPDGKLVAHYDFLPFADSAIRILDLQSGEEVLRWPVHGEQGILPSWSPDSRWMTFGTYAAGTDAFGIWAIDVHANKAVHLVQGPFTRPAWSNDGKLICFDIRLAPYSQLWAVSAERLNQLPRLSPREYLATIAREYKVQRDKKMLRPSPTNQLDLAYGLWKYELPEESVGILRSLQQDLADLEQSSPATEARFYAMLARAIPQIESTEGLPTADECRSQSIQLLRSAYEQGELTIATARRDPLLALLMEHDAYSTVKHEYQSAREIAEQAIANGHVVTVLYRGQTQRLGISSPLPPFDFTVTGLQARNDPDISSYAVHLANLWSLKSIDFSGSAGVGPLLPQLAELPHLKELRLANTQVADADLEHIKALAALDTLDLSATNISNAALPIVGRLKGLMFLDLSETQITDQGITSLANLSSLRELIVRNTPVTQRSLAVLQGLSRLAQLDARGTGIDGPTLRDFARSARASRGNHASLELTEAYRPEGRVMPVDITQRANRPFAEVDGPYRALAEFAMTKHELLGVPFEVGSGYVDTRYLDREESTERTDIKVSQHVQRLYFLHAAEDAKNVPDGTLIGAYDVTYADGENVHIPLIIGVNLRDWWDYPNLPAQSRLAKDARVAWRRASTASRNWSKEHATASLRMYVYQWENPTPGNRIESLGLHAYDSAKRNEQEFRLSGGGAPQVNRVSQSAPRPAPFCLAITAELVQTAQ